VKLQGRHVVVTGGSRGIGARIGAAFAAEGAQVTLCARGEGQLAATAGEIGARHVTADLTKTSGLPKLVEQLEALGPVDVLVNNAGIGLPRAFEDLTAEQLQALFTLNALVPAELSRLLIPSMRQRGTSRLVFISSLSAQVALPGLTAYSATKAAVSQLAEGLRRDLTGSGVGVTTAELGPIRTDLYAEIEEYPPCVNAFNRLIRLGFLRMLEPEDVAGAVVRACRADRARVVLPRRGRTQVAAAHLPQWLANRMLRG
jgi:short-subunit dehydrogenase